VSKRRARSLVEQLADRDAPRDGRPEATPDDGDPRNDPAEWHRGDQAGHPRGDAWEGDEAPKTETHHGVETVTASDLMGMTLPPPRWAVEGVLPEGLTVLAGKPKLGKSWLMLHLALAVAQGGTALGKIGVEAGEVLYIALEDTRRRLQARMRRLLGPGESAPAGLHLATAWPRQDKGGLEQLDGWLHDHPLARLVLIDTWGRWRPFRAQGNSYELDYADGAALKEVGDRRRVPITASHHCRKLPAEDPIEEVSGSVGLTGACDGILVLRRDRGQHDAALHVTGRDIEEAELGLTFDKQLCLWQLVGEAEAGRVSRERRAILDLFTAGVELTCKQVEATTGKKRDAVKQLLSRMARDGQLVATERGNYRIAREQSPRSPSHQEGAW
jgi:hypothetical protein